MIDNLAAALSVHVYSKTSKIFEYFNLCLILVKGFVFIIIFVTCILKLTLAQKYSDNTVIHCQSDNC